MMTEVEFALLKREVEDLRSREEQNLKRIEDLEAQDKNRMRWAISSLGAVVMGLALYIWAFKVDGK